MPGGRPQLTLGWLQAKRGGRRTVLRLQC
eukprot:COSAG05_NODE_24068_length_254_cov_0.625806_1_plen_28_part_10